MAGESSYRLGNLLAALALGVVNEATVETELATGIAGSGTPALIALRQFLNGCNVGRLADVLGLTHSGAVRLVAQLESAGYVRRRHLDDRRQVNVVLTAKGRRAAASAAAARMNVLQEALRGLTAAERRELEPLIVRLVERMVASRIPDRAEYAGRPWWCRTCDFSACGRDEGGCPAANTAAATERSRSSLEP